MNEKSIVFRLIFEQGCPVFVIAKKLNTSEIEIYRFLNGEKISSEAEKKLELLWLDLVDMGETFKNVQINVSNSIHLK